VKRLFSIWKKLIFERPEMLELMVPVSSLSFKSICRRLESKYSSSGMGPCKRLKFKSICSRERISPSLLGMVPVRMPSSRIRCLRVWRRLSSDGSVPATPFCSNSIRVIKSSSLHPNPPHPHSLPPVNQALLLDSNPATLRLHAAFAAASASAFSSSVASSSNSGGAEHSVHRSPRVLK